MSIFTPDPAARQPLTADNFFHALIPPLTAYTLTSLLVQLPNTYYLRLALLPVTIALTYRTGTGYAFEDPVLNVWNHANTMIMFLMAMRATEWSLRRSPLRRQRTESCPEPTSVVGKLLSLANDTYDLCINFRGIEQSFGRGCYIVPETRNTTSRTAFIKQTFIRTLGAFLAFDTFLTSLRLLGLDDAENGGLVYDPSLPPRLRYTRSTLIGFLTGMCIYSGITLLYNLSSIIHIGIFQHRPSNWPPLFDKPLVATSLADFWGRHWHQMFRQTFLFCGGKPGALIGGKVGGLLGVFLISGLLHDWGMWGMGKGVDYLHVTGYFMAQGLGLLVEAAWEKASGKKVCGCWGMLFTGTWVIALAQMLGQAWHTRGLAGNAFFPRVLSPSWWLVRILSGQ